MKRSSMRGAVAGAAIAVGLLTAVLPEATGAAQSAGGLVVKVEGLPPGERPVVVVRSPSGRRTVARGATLTIPNAAPGEYVIEMRRHRVAKTWRTIRRGAQAFPTQSRLPVTVQPGAVATVPAAYGTIINPRVSKVPSGLRYIVGSPENPRELVFRSGARVPRRGQILLGAASSTFPNGLAVKVQSVRRSGKNRVVRVRPTTVSAAVPTFTYTGTGIDLVPTGPTEASAARARAARSACNGSSQFDMGAKLDEFKVRRATAKAWPPQMSFQVAIRTTERFGPRAAVAGVSCNWTLAQLGPWQGAIPTPIGVPIPVYATIPVTASVNVEGALSAFRLNLASTSVLNIELGKHNDVGFWQEGSNVWLDGVLQMSGSASASLNLTLQMGVGSATAGNLHVNAGFGPNASWTGGAGCSVDLALGSLSAGVKIGWFSATSPAFSPFTVNLWRGCEGAPPVGANNTGGGSTPPPTTPTSPPPTTSPPPPTTQPPPAPQVWREQQGSLGANTFTNPYNASGMGPKIAAYQWVDVTCKVYAPQIQSANPDGYWYRIASAPWNNAYYAVANTFWNGDIPGQKPYTHNTDWAVPNC